ncbi:MAG: DUF885 family protein [Myxococcaceae bacterium]
MCLPIAAATLTLTALSGTPTIESLPIPGNTEFVRITRDIVDVLFAIDPSQAAGAGLFQDALRVPSFAPEVVKGLVTRLDADLAALRAMPWRQWPVDRQIDFRWIFANAETARHQLMVEKLYRRRPAAWLESLANTQIALLTYVPEAKADREKLWVKVPAMLQEIRKLATEVTRRDLETAAKLTAALQEMARSDGAEEARAALETYGRELTSSKPQREAAVVGPEAYAWRLRRSLLLPWTPAQLLDQAERDLASVDQRIGALKAKVKVKPEPTAAQKKLAAALSAERFLGLHDQISAALRRATLDGKFVSIPAGVGPLRARETPDAMVPLTGDGGSMNPPPPFVPIDVGYWNVERFASIKEEDRLPTVLQMQGFRQNGMGPYAAHEGIPGHHLQLALARLHANPLRSLLPDPVFTEGWALYSEEALWEHGGLGPSVEAEYAVAKSYRFRVARVVYDVRVETGEWDLQKAADFKSRAEPGKGEIDEDLLRAIQWPTQLICYYSGKAQILALRDAYKKRMGKKYSDRAFHDALLAEGSIPVSLIRAKLLDEPVPSIGP